jgi:hypothetical protein
MTKDELDAMIDEIEIESWAVSGENTRYGAEKLRDKILSARCTSTSPSGFSCELEREHLQAPHQKSIEGTHTVINWNNS